MTSEAVWISIATSSRPARPGGMELADWKIREIGYQLLPFLLTPGTLFRDPYKVYIQRGETKKNTRNVVLYNKMCPSFGVKSSVWVTSVSRVRHVSLLRGHISARVHVGVAHFGVDEYLDDELIRPKPKSSHLR